MKKKILCGTLAAVMMMGAYPVSAFAEEPMHTLTKSLDFREADEDLSGDGWNWDAGSMTLTLENFRYSVPENKLAEKAAIYLPDDSFVEIEGEDNILETNSFRCNAFYCDGQVNVYGDGKLLIEQADRGSSAFYVYRGPILFDDEVEITIESKGYLIYLKHARGNDPLITIEDEAKLIFNKEYHIGRNVLLTVKYDEDESGNWLDYAEIEDDWDDDYMHLVARDAVKTEKPAPETPAETPEAEEPAVEEPATQSEYQITIGNEAIKKDGYVTYISDAKPYLSHGYTMLPLRALLTVTESDADVKWDAATKTVTIQKGDHKASIVIGKDMIATDNGELNVSTPAELNSGRAFVSLRDWMNILSALDMPASELKWDAKTKTVTFMK